MPADVFGAGKVLVFGEVIDKNGGHYVGDIRGVLKSFANEMFTTNGYTLNAANEIEGFLFEGIDAERTFHETGSFEYVNKGGYYHSLPGDPLREFIDTTAEVQRAMGFENEKDHPEVAPSQFEINYTYGDVVAAADQIQLYKLICRQVATQMGMTASFLPKPVTGVNGSGMHTNVSITKRRQEPVLGSQGRGKDLEDGVGVRGPDPHPRQRHLPAAECQRQRLSPPRSALRSSQPDQGFGHRSRLDGPHPHRQREVGARRSALGRSGREPLHGALLGLQDRPARRDWRRSKNLRQAERYLPDNVYTAIDDFRNAEWTTTLLGADVKQRYADLKQASADRCPRLLGTIVKPCEVQFHHDVYNQLLWGQF